jgi:hypothetical protein
VTSASPPPLAPRAFRERFALATFPDGGVVLNVETGSYARLNAAGAAVLEELARADDDAAARAAIAARLRAPDAVAAEHLAALTAGLEAPGVRIEPPDPFRYRVAEGGGYNLWHGPTRVLHVDADGRTLALVSPPEALSLRVYDYVSAVAPKLLFLRGVTVLHGSSCLHEGRLGGICGKSRAGKTTTARTLARHGRKLVSEDLLVLGPDLTAPRVFVGGEGHVDRWARAAAATLAAGAGTTTSVDELLGAAGGDDVPLASIWFLDAARRGASFAARPLARARALELVLANHFLGAGGTETWRRHLASCHAIASHVTAYELDVPNGLDRLDEALARYTTNSAS